MAKGFVRWTLRTSDVDAARAFYDALLEEGAPDVTELPAHVRARGAPPHWLGYLATPDVGAALEAFVARGATRLGPGELVRDPGGAVLALTTPAVPARHDVIWHQLLCPDPAQAASHYGELFGMTVGARVIIPPHGAVDELGWGTAEVRGSIASIAGKPGIHPQWLFFFRTHDLERAVAQVRAGAGSVLDTTDLPDGHQMAICTDPHGAQFGLMTARR